MMVGVKALVALEGPAVQTIFGLVRPMGRMMTLLAIGYLWRVRGCPSKCWYSKEVEVVDCAAWAADRSWTLWEGSCRHESSRPYFFKNVTKITEGRVRRVSDTVLTLIGFAIQ